MPMTFILRCDGCQEWQSWSENYKKVDDLLLCPPCKHSYVFRNRQGRAF